MELIIDFYQQNSNWLEPLVFILIFFGIALLAFKGRGSIPLVVGISLLLSVSFIIWARENGWHLQDWGIFGFILITLSIVVCAVNFVLRSRPQ